MGSHAPNGRTVLQNWQDKTAKAFPKKQFIMEYLAGLQDTKPLRSCSGNRAKMLLKSHLGIKYHSEYNNVIRFLQHSSAIVNAGDWGRIGRDLETIIVSRWLTLSLMVDIIKGCAEINLYDPSVVPTLLCTLQCMRHAQKCITGSVSHHKP